MAKNTKKIEELKAQLAKLEAEETNEIIYVEDAEVITEDVNTSENDLKEDTVQGIPMRTIIYLGQKEDGGLLFSIDGDKNLLILDGLLDYAKRELDSIWKKQMEANAQHEGEVQ